jgi:cobalt/nickel transport system permease protein
MHIPDGYLGPQTYGTFYAIMAPIWFFASRILRKSLKAKHASYLALGAAFSFVIMMFNIPAPGGTTGHAVGGALIAIIMGPWPALMAVSIALVIQALLFGDGGITAIGANCFNMAFVMPFTGYYIYRILGSKSVVFSTRRIFAAGVAGYLSLNLAAFFAAVEFGIQPLIAHTPDGTPLYAPYPLNIAVPVMAFEHLILFGFIEAIITALVVAYIARTDPVMLGFYSLAPVPEGMKTARSSKKLWACIGILVILTPLGLLASGAAWGEWSSEQLQSILGYVPEGLKKLEGIWQYTLMSDYNFSGWNTPFMTGLGYILSAFVGVGVIVFVAFLASRFLPADRRS